MNPMFEELSRTKRRRYGLSVWDRIDATGDCWVWTGAINAHGYGAVQALGKLQYVHRVVYQALVGEIHDGLDIDHLCRNLKCCNPDHLEPVTRAVNLQRGWNSNGNKVACPQGHSYSGDTLRLYIDKNGVKHRNCRTCDNAAADRQRKRRG